MVFLKLSKISEETFYPGTGYNLNAHKTLEDVLDIFGAPYVCSQETVIKLVSENLPKFRRCLQIRKPKSSAYPGWRSGLLFSCLSQRTVLGKMFLKEFDENIHPPSKLKDVVTMSTIGCIDVASSLEMKASPTSLDNVVAPLRSEIIVTFF